MYCQTCRSSVNATVFEQQLGHLHYHEREIQFRNISYLYDVDDELCDRTSIASPMLLTERSVCPWQIVRDVNEHRYPPVLNIARCRCSRCLGHNECRPVTYRIPVLEKTCLNGVFEYIKSYVTVPVGCICVRPRVLQVKKRLLLDLLRRGKNVREFNKKIYENIQSGSW